MSIRKYVSLGKLSLYDEKIKTLIDSKKNEAIESSDAYANSILNEHLAQAVVVYVGSGTPSDDTGNDNDIYIDAG